jgi:hypothetical protein
VFQHLTLRLLKNEADVSSASIATPLSNAGSDLEHWSRRRFDIPALRLCFRDGFASISPT